MKILTRSVAELLIIVFFRCLKILLFYFVFLQFKRIDQGQGQNDALINTLNSRDSSEIIKLI